MARWYQNVLTGEQREVKTLAEDDYYVDNAANWARIPAPTSSPPASPSDGPGPAPAEAVAVPRAKKKTDRT